MSLPQDIVQLLLLKPFDSSSTSPRDSTSDVTRYPISSKHRQGSSHHARSGGNSACETYLDIRSISNQQTQGFSTFYNNRLKENLYTSRNIVISNTTSRRPDLSSLLNFELSRSLQNDHGPRYISVETIQTPLPILLNLKSLV